MRWLAFTFGEAMGSLFQVLQLSSAYGGSCHVGAGRLRLLRMEGHIAVLAERYGNLAKTTLAAIDTVNEAGDGYTADIFTAVSRFLDKALWFLEAHETNKA
jgi:hypothetical protein